MQEIRGNIFFWSKRVEYKKFVETILRIRIEPLMSGHMTSSTRRMNEFHSASLTDFIFLVCLPCTQVRQCCCAFHYKMSEEEARDNFSMLPGFKCPSRLWLSAKLPFNHHRTLKRPSLTKKNWYDNCSRTSQHSVSLDTIRHEHFYVYEIKTHLFSNFTSLSHVDCNISKRLIFSSTIPSENMRTSNKVETC